MSALPAPLTPPLCDLRDFQFMPLDVVRLRDSDLAANQTPEACWAAVLLWSAAWHQVPAGSIPSDEKWIAKAAGYAQRGKIDRLWAKVRDGALHRWIKCSDGRLYHPVVAEKAIEAWKGKLVRRWHAECAKIKKRNQRNPLENNAIPNYEEWLSQNCPEGQDGDVPRDNDACPYDVPRETTSKGQGEGQGQGQGEGQYIKMPTSPDGADAPSSEVHPAGPETLASPVSDEDRFWALAPQCEAKGITRSRLGKLLKLAAAGATSMPAACKLVAACLRAKDPSTYFGAAVREIEVDANLVKPKAGKFPAWVEEWRAAGETVQSIGPDQRSARGNVYDDSGKLISW